MTEEVIFYAVKNSEGKHFRRKGYGGSGNSWVDSIATARIWANLRGARTVVSWFALHYPSYPILSIVEMKVTEFKVIDETQRIEKVRAKKATLAKTQELRQRKAKFNKAKELYDAAMKNVNDYYKGTGV